MDGQTPPIPTPTSWKRRLFRAAVLCFLLMIAAVAALPWALSLPAVRNVIVKTANGYLAPGKLSVRTIVASWVSPIRLGGVTLVDGKGKTLVTARQVVVEHSLLSLATSPHTVGTIVLDGAVVDIERRADGSIDLVDALIPPKPSKPATAPTPEPADGTAPTLSASLRVLRGTLKLKSPELAEPLVASKFDMEVSLPWEPTKPLSWRIRLAEPPGGTAAETLGIDGTYDHNAKANPDLTLAIKGERWPLVLNGASLGAPATVKTRLDGVITAARKGGHWESLGDARLLDLDASGPALAGDTLALDRVAAAWDLTQSAEAWEVHKLDMKSAVAELHGAGTVGAKGESPSAQIDASVDLAALARQAPHALHLREGLTLQRGSAKVSASFNTRGDTQSADLNAKLSDLVARDAKTTFTLKEPATLAAKGSRSPDGFRVETLRLKAASADLNGSGDLAKGVTLSGRIDLAAMQAQFRELIDFGGVELAGQGRLAADYRKSDKGFVARAAADVRGLKVAGLTAQPVTRDSAKLDAVLGGPVDPSGLPSGWLGLRLNVKSERDSLAAAATQADGTVVMNATVSTPLTVSAREGQVDGRVVGRWTAGKAPGTGVFEFEDLRAALKPTDPALIGQGTVSLAVRGKVDLGTEDVSLLPQPAGPGTALQLGAEGLTLHGFSKIPTPQRSAKFAVEGDAAAIDRALVVWMGQTAQGLAGSVSAHGVLNPDAKGRLGFSLNVVSPDLSRTPAGENTPQGEGPITLGARGSYQSEGGNLVFEELGLVTRYAGLTASGKLDDATGRRVADLQGNLIPNWQALTTMIAASVEPNLRLTGGPRPFRVKGPLSGDSLAAMLKGLDAELGLNLESADAFGMRLGAAPLVVRCGGGNITVDQIKTTLNNGRVELLPGLDVDPVRGIALRLFDGSVIENAEINDEVSRRVLRYVAPVLDKATHVNGKVTVNISQGDIPITGPPDHKLTLTGQLVFQDVVFAPGPFAGELLALTGKPDSPGLKLHQPVQLSVANGRVMQKGLEIPVRKDAVVSLEGSVGFDQTLDLKAGIPLTKGMLGGVAAGAGLDGLVDGRRVVVPIGGTVEHPKLNRQALQVALRELTRDVIKKGVSQQASGLLKDLVPGAEAGAGADSNAPADPVKQLGDAALRRLIPRPRGNRQP